MDVEVGYRSLEVAPPEPWAVPWLMLSYAEVLALGLDEQERLLLSLIDGRTTVDALIERAGVPRRDVLLLLSQWRAVGIIEFKGGDRPLATT